MTWYDLRNPDDPHLDELAKTYHLHPLHIEDCRHRRQRAKVEEGDGYLFVVLKPVDLTTEGEVTIGDLDFFLGRDFLITVLEDRCPALTALLDGIKAQTKDKRPDQIFYRIVDALVDSYLPILDSYSEEIDKIEDSVLEEPTPGLLQRIFDIKRSLIELRRVLTNSRDVAGHLQRTETDLIQRDLAPFLRDLYDHLARNLDLVEMQRDLLTGSMDIYLSSVANRTNQVMKVLTVLGTVALPAVVVSSFFGMNTQDLPWSHTPHGTLYAAALMAVSTAGLLWLLKRWNWL